MKYTLTNRPTFCPIGTQGVVRMLPETFVKLCKFHSNAASAPAGIGKIPIALMYKRACDECSIISYINKGVDPTLIVSDVSWITHNELQQLQEKIVNTAVILSNKQIKKITINKGYKMKHDLLKLQRLLNEMGEIVNSLLNTHSASDTIVEAKTPSKLHDNIEHDQVIAPIKDQSTMSVTTLELAKKLYDCEQAGESREHMSDTYNRSKKHVGVLIRKYKAYLMQNTPDV